MLYTNYIKPSQVFDFARSTSRHNTQAMPLYELLRLRIIYNLVNPAESLTCVKQTTNSSSFKQAKTTNQSKLAKAEIFGSLAVALVLITMFGGVA
tara:strand:- start:455 stop:739 length:285 start_codon:yes stop_codon:yes gene_type:complete